MIFMSSEDVQLLDSKKTLGGLDIFLGMITVMFFLDTLGPVAAMGTASITWMLIIAVIFFVPYGLITAELGSTYPDEGGMYAWVKRAFGKRWGVRVTWMYWVNNAVWISSATIFIIGVACQLFMPNTSFPIQLVLSIVLIWLVILVGLRPLNESKWVTNVSGIIKLLIAAGIIISAVIYISQGNVAANDFSLTGFIPKLGDSFIFFPALIYNFLGFEVMSAMGSQMKNPKKDVPRAVISNAFLITALYILVTTSILMIIPADKVNIVESIMDCFMVALGGGAASIVVVVFGLMFLSILFGQIVTWITAACNMAAEASADGELPKVFAIRHKKNGTPMGTLIITGVIGTFLTVLWPDGRFSRRPVLDAVLLYQHHLPDSFPDCLSGIYQDEKDRPLDAQAVYFSGRCRGEHLFCTLIPIRYSFYHCSILLGPRIADRLGI